MVSGAARPLGSRVGFGTAALHHLHRQADRQKLLDAAYEAGIRYFDTAPLYGHGLAERELGLFRSRLSRNDPIVISTKVGLLPNTVVHKIPSLLLPYAGLRNIAIRTGMLPRRWRDFRRSFSAATLRSSVLRSLESLRSSSLEILYLHEPRLEDIDRLDAFAGEAKRLQSEGLVEHFGVSGAMPSAKVLLMENPTLAERLQIELQPSMMESDSDTAWVRQHAHATFGHLRLSPVRSATQTHILSLEPIAKMAVSANPGGTILFSTNRRERIRAFVEAIDAADRSHAP